MNLKGSVEIILEDSNGNLFFTGWHNEDMSGNITRRYFMCSFRRSGQHRASLINE